MAQPGTAPASTNVPITITVAGGNYTVSVNQQDVTLQYIGDSVTFSAVGGDCLVAFQGVPLGLMVPSGGSVTVQACLATGTCYWTPGAPRGAAGLPYKIKVGSGVKA